MVGRVLTVVFAITVTLVAAMGAWSQERTAPNIVILMADDLGWADVGYHHRRARTPNIDRLAADGIELDRFTVAPMCSPTRAACLTGRYPIRFGLARAVIPPGRDFGIPPSERTIAECLAKSGYAHRAAFGKWHLGHRRPQWHPLRNGFTHFYGHYNGAIDYFTHVRDGQRDWHRDWEPSADEGYTTDLIAAATADWITQHASSDLPYFCYVAFNAPHSPFQAKSSDLARFEHLGGDASKVDEHGATKGPLDGATRRLAVAAMTWSLDEAIGRIFQAIDSTNEADNTIVWFFSDNGGIAGVKDSNAPLRGNKLDVFDGGVRVPACVRWPARWPGGRRISEPLNVIDVFPTLQSAAGASCAIEDGSAPPLDGIDLGPLLSGAAETLPTRDLYFYHGQNGPENEKIAVAAPEWKLIVHGPDLSRTRQLTDEHEVLLFRWPNDWQEKENLARQHPEVVGKLAEKLISFRQLQPENGVPPYAVRDPDFVPPQDWRLSPSN